MGIWKLYWVSSDGYEDCFVVAKNCRSAAHIEVAMNGFSYSDVSVMRVADIPDELFQIYGQDWPWYADHQLLKDLGARTRTIDNGIYQVLLDGRVYSRDSDGEWSTYLIGFKAICERNPALPRPDFSEEETEDYHKYIYDMMGMAIVQCHKIEWLISRSFLSAVIKRRKNKDETFEVAFSELEKKTLGSLIASLEKSFDIDVDIHNLLRCFLDMRNQFIHGITLTDRYNIEDNWGQRELISFLDVFLSAAEMVEEISSGFFEMGLKVMENAFPDAIDKGVPFNYNDDLLGLFASCFEFKAPSSKNS